MLREMLVVGGEAPQSEVNPFRGLLPFDERHSRLFFGREDDIAAAVERLRTLQSVLPVVGPSGAGKSSFVQAGVIPRLREHGPLGVLQLRPGARPFSLLAARFVDAWRGKRSGPFGSVGFTTGSHSEEDTEEAPDREVEDPGFPLEPDALAERLQERPELLNLLLHRLAGRAEASVLLFVDQLEELYTMVEDAEERRRFMQAICMAADDPVSPVRVIFSLREEYISRLAEGAEAREALSHITVLRPPGPEALVEILVCPVEAMGYDFEDPDMVREMVAEVEGEVACLPLMQFAGQVLWERRDQTRQLLRRKDAEAMGGVAGALARHADGTLKGLSPEELAGTRNLLLRLVTSDGTRRVVPRQVALQGLGGDVEAVLSRLVDARLVVVRQQEDEGGSGAALELVHESLVESWGRLRRWIEESREELVFLAEVGQAADLWARRGEREEEVWQGRTLRDARAAMDACTTEVALPVRRFIAAGERKDRARGRRRRAGLAVVIAALALVAAGAVLAALAITQQKREVQARMLEVQRRKAEAQHGAARAALAKGDMLEARANLRGAMETLDNAQVRTLWWRLRREPAVWRRKLGGLVYRVSISPDGRTLAAACQDQSIYLLDTRTRAVRVLRGHRDQVFGVHFSPGGNVLASGTWGGEVGLWDLKTGALKQLKPHKAGINTVRVSPDGKLLATGSLDKTIHLYDLPGGALRAVLSGHSGPVYDVRFTPDSERVVSGAGDSVRVWDAATGKQLRQLEGGTSVAVSPDGRLLASHESGISVRLTDMKTWKVVRVLRGHSRPIQDLAFSPDGKLLASAALDDTSRVWEVKSGAVHRVLRGHTAGVWGVAFSPDSKWLATGGLDHSARMWRLDGPATPPEDGGHRGIVTRLAFSPDGKVIASASYDKEVRLWTAADGKPARVLRGHRAVVHSVRFSPDGKLLASGGDDQTVRLWDVSSGHEVRVLRGHRVSIWGLAFSPDGELLASASRDRTVRIWEVKSGRCLQTLTGHLGPALAVSFSPDGKLFASAGEDRFIYVRDTATWSLRARLEGHDDSVWGLGFSPDGGVIYTADAGGLVRATPAAGGPGRLLGKHAGRVYDLGIHPGGKVLGTVGSDGSLTLWDLDSGTHRAIRGHRSEVNGLAFSPDGLHVATGGDDRNVRLWKVASGLPVWGGPRQDRSTGGEVLCSVSATGALELRSGAGAQPRARLKLTEAASGLVALKDACLALVAGEVRMLTMDGRARTLFKEVSSISRSGEDALVASGSRLMQYNRFWGTRRTFTTDRGISAAAMVGPYLALGYREGNVELKPTDGRPRSLAMDHAFEGVGNGAVVRIIPGPEGTLGLGFADGLFGLWSLRDGARLWSHRLNGPVRELELRKGKLSASSELGQSLTLDLTLLQRPYCQVLRKLWREVPVIWKRGLPTVALPDPEHRCSSKEP